MKKLVLSALLLAFTLTVGAVRPMHKLFPVKQSDGTTVMLYKNGDGHLAFYTTEDNKVVVRDANGRLCYAELNSNGNLTATRVAVHNLAERSAEEQSFVSTLTLKPTDEKLLPLLQDPYHSAESGAMVKHAGNSSTSDGLGRFGTNSGGAVPSNGELTVPVIMVQFTDMSFLPTSTTEKLTRYFNQEGYNEDNPYEAGSVRDYFLAQSYGHFSPTFNIVAKVTLPHPYSYYGANSYGGHDNRSMDLFRDAVAAAVNSGVDFSNFEVNGVIPNVVLMYAGEGEATGGDENTIWPHERDLGGYWGTTSGYTFGSYFMGNERYSGSMLAGIGIFVHEFSHALGLPDFYVTDYSYSNDAPFGFWSVMDEGEYNGNSYAPVGYTAYERSYMGWLNIRELSDAESVTLANPADTDAAYAVMFRNPSNQNEYFILENRQPGTWYPSSSGSGLMVSRITFDRSSWMGNIVNNDQNKKHAMIVTADGSTLVSGANASHLFGNGVNYSESLPLYNGSNLTTDPFYKVIKNDNGTITFSFKSQNLIPQQIVANGKVFEKVTDVSQLTSGDSVIIVSEGQSVALSNDAQGTRRAATYVSINGNKVTSNDDVLVFSLLYSSSADRWGFRTGNSYLNVSSNGVSLARNTTNALTQISFANGNATVHFTGRVNRYLGYADPETYFTSFESDPANIQIYRLQGGVADGINAVRSTTEKSADSRVYNLNGQYVGNSLTGLQKGVYIQNGKKVVVK